jgi:hypothetical protein
MSMKFRFSAAFIALAFFSFANAQDDTGSGLPEGLKIIPHAYGHFEAGEIENGSLIGNTYIDKINGANHSQFQIDHVWTEDAVMWAGFEAKYKTHFKAVFELGGKLYFSYPEQNDERNTKNNRQELFIDKVYSEYTIGGDLKNPLLLGQVGYFYFKYNENGRNFGDYLFRTGTYPIYFDMSFDFPVARILGFHLQSNPLPGLKVDGILGSSIAFPAMNWSFAALVNYDVANVHFLKVGAGIDFAHLLSVYTPHSFPVMFGGDPTEPHGTVNDRYVKSVAQRDSIVNGVSTPVYDTTWGYYTFKGTKAMGQISMDFKTLFPSKIWGENDLILYAEADIIGIKNYPDSGSENNNSLTLVAPSYNKWWEKMPIMIGFNLPTFKVLDVLNGEIEWFGARYYNDPSLLLNNGSRPLPSNVQNTMGDIRPLKSQFKWSVFAQKSLNPHFAICGQVGRDHLRLGSAAYNFEMYNELLTQKDDWWWVLKTKWYF